MTRWQTGHDLDLAFRRAVAHIVERDARIAQEFREGRPVAREAREHETAVRSDPRGALHGAVGVRRLHARAFVSLRQRNASNGAVEMKAPGVIGADETRSRVARHRPAQLDAAVRTAVVEHMDAPLPVPHHDHRLASDLHGVIIARRLDLRFVPAIDPHLLEDLLDLPIEDFLIRVDGAVNAIRLNQLADRPHSLPPVVVTVIVSMIACCSGAAIRILPSRDTLCAYLAANGEFVCVLTSLTALHRAGTDA